MAETLADQLEGLVDAHGLAAVLAGLATACDEKGNHLRHNWQDKASARPWEAIGWRLDRLRAKAEDLGLGKAGA